MDYWALALLLLAIGMGLAILEVFFPSGGLLGFLCVASIIASVVLGFQSSAAWGIGVLTTAILALPVVVVVALNLLPNTRVGRKIILEAPTARDVLPDDPREKSLKELVGRTGQARSRMMPAGVVKIGGRTVDAVTEGMPVDPGQTVRVVEVRGNRVVVRPVDPGEPPPRPSAEPGDPLSRPIDQIAADPFDESPGPPPLDKPPPAG